MSDIIIGIHKPKGTATMTARTPSSRSNRINFESERSAQIMEDVTFMVKSGEDFENACRRVGLSKTGVEQKFTRAGKSVPRSRR